MQEITSYELDAKLPQHRQVAGRLDTFSDHIRLGFFTGLDQVRKILAPAGSIAQVGEQVLRRAYARHGQAIKHPEMTRIVFKSGK